MMVKELPSRIYRAVEELSQSRHGNYVFHINYTNMAKGVFNHSNQLSNFSKNWGMRGGKTEFHEFRGLILPHFNDSQPENMYSEL